MRIGAVQLTTLLRRSATALRLGRAEAPRAGAGPAERTALAQPTDRVAATTVLGLSPRERRAVLDPVRVLAREGRQSDQTTCGSAVLVMLAAAGDPALALWLATGRRAGPLMPAALAGAPDALLATLESAVPERRFAALQRVMKQRTNAGALLGLPWPHALGTPPWGAARAARFGSVTYRSVMIDDTDRPHLVGILSQVTAALDRGVPVPLYSGGDTSAGLAHAVPRHVVLAIGRTADGLEVWEPASGRVHVVAKASLLEPGPPLRALGGWSHLTWAILPR